MPQTPTGPGFRYRSIQATSAMMQGGEPTGSLDEMQWNPGPDVPQTSTGPGFRCRSIQATFAMMQGGESTGAKIGAVPEVYGFDATMVSSAARV